MGRAVRAMLILVPICTAIGAAWLLTHGAKAVKRQVYDAGLAEWFV